MLLSHFLMYQSGENSSPLGEDFSIFPTSALVQYLKGKCSYKMLMEHKSLSKLYWGRHLWGRGYFVATSGNITDEVVMKAIL